MPLPSAVFFDLDGTLVNTGPLWVEAQQNLVAESGGHWASSLEQELVGLNLPMGAKLLKEVTGISLSDQKIISRLVRSVELSLRSKPVDWCQGIPFLLERLRLLKIPTLIVTSSYRPIAQAVVDTTIPGTFAGIVSGEQVNKTKPHPQPFLLAAALVGVPIQSCLIIEDSPIGISSALASGGVTIAIPNLIPIFPQPSLTIVRSADELDEKMIRQSMRINLPYRIARAGAEGSTRPDEI